MLYEKWNYVLAIAEEQNLPPSDCSSPSPL